MACLSLFGQIQCAQAIDLNQKVTLKWDIDKVDVRFNEIPDLVQKYQKYYYKGFEVKLPSKDDCSEEDAGLELLEKREKEGINRWALRNHIQTEIAPKIFEEKIDVSIQSNSGVIVFDQNGRNGRQIHEDKAVHLLKKSLEDGINTVLVPLAPIRANVNVTSPELYDMGIKEVVATGVSDFRGSPYNRIHNIKLGLSRFNGVVVGSGSLFSFGKQLGVVEGYTGYLPELVIKGDKTIPEYGGGLCQVTSTGFRAVLLSGFPVMQRKNHSYAVSYYHPPGTDAAIYYPSVDLKFVNNGASPILMQTYTEGTKAYFTFYGTKDERDVKLFGPYISNWRPVPDTRIEYTDSLAPGQKKKLGDAHTGYDAYWHRLVRDDHGSNMIEETIFSRYQARPLYYLVGNSGESEEASDA